MTELYVTGVVIANGIPDSDGDVLNKKEIKEIFTKYTVQQTDTQHSYIRNEGVDVLANWISETPTIIGGKSVPAGSWLCTTKVTNPDLCELLINQTINSYSLGSTPKSEILPLINKGMTYSEVANIEDIVPIFISFVKKGANGYTFEVMSHEVFINKNDKSEDFKMTENKVEVPIDNETISIGALEKVKNIFGINKSDDAGVEAVEPVQEKTIEPFDKDALMTEVEDKISKGIEAGLKAFAEKQAEIKEEEAKIKEADAQKEEEKEEAEPEKVKAVEIPEEEQINKEEKSTVKTEEATVPETNTNFYKLSGRDSFGCKIKK